MNDNFWKKVGEELNAQIKKLTEKQAINTAKQPNEIYEATRKEMKNETLIGRLETEKRYVSRATARLIGEAIAEIERLEATRKEMNDDFWKKAAKAVDAQVKELAEKQVRTWIYTRDVGALYREAVAKLDRLEAEVKELGEENIRLEAQLKQNNTEHMEVLNELSDKYNTAVVENGRLKLEVVKKTTYANADLIERNIRLEAEVSAYKYADAMLKARERK